MRSEPCTHGRSPDDSFLPSRNRHGRLSCQTEKPHSRNDQRNGKAAAPGAATKQNPKSGKSTDVAVYPVTAWRPPTAGCRRGPAGARGSAPRPRDPREASGSCGPEAPSGVRFVPAFAFALSETLAGSTGELRRALAPSRSSSSNSIGARRRRMCHSTCSASMHSRTSGETPHCARRGGHGALPLPSSRRAARHVPAVAVASRASGS